jgi:hypothetical protein
MMVHRKGRTSKVIALGLAIVDGYVISLVQSRTTDRYAANKHYPTSLYASSTRPHALLPSKAIAGSLLPSANLTLLSECFLTSNTMITKTTMPTSQMNDTAAKEWRSIKPSAFRSAAS